MSTEQYLKLRAAVRKNNKQGGKNGSNDYGSITERKL